MPRAIRGLVLSALALGVLLAPVLALGSHDTSQDVQFWAFSLDGRFMLVIIKDEARGDMLAIKQVGRLASIYEMALPAGIQPAQLPHYLKYPPFNAYGFVDPGAMGEAAPDGSAMIMTANMPGQLQLFMARGEKMVKMFAIPLGRSPSGTQFAEARIKEVRWSATGKATAIIVHQSMKDAYGMEVDQLISFDPTPYKEKLGPLPAPPQQPPAQQPPARR